LTRGSDGKRRRDAEALSPEADLITGVVVAVVGIDALRHVSRPSQIVLAALPMLSALHQVDESFVWWGLRGQLPFGVTHAAIYIFLAFAFALPFLVPLAMFRSESVRWRRLAMGALLANLAVVGVINWLTFTGLTSLWCAWAAIGSVAIAVYLRRVAGQDARPAIAAPATA
jgi:hypothetical protein